MRSLGKSQQTYFNTCFSEKSWTSPLAASASPWSVGESGSEMPFSSGYPLSSATYATFPVSDAILSNAQVYACSVEDSKGGGEGWLRDNKNDNKHERRTRAGHGEYAQLYLSQCKMVLVPWQLAPRHFALHACVWTQAARTGRHLQSTG